MQMCFVDYMKTFAPVINSVREVLLAAANEDSSTICGNLFFTENFMKEIVVSLVNYFHYEINRIKAILRLMYS